MQDDETILVVDDSEAELELIRLAFQWAKLDCPIKMVKSGIQAMDYLEGKGKYQNRKLYPLPVVILLDIKMPAVDGFEVLTAIKTHPAWKRISVIILTGMGSPADLSRAYELGASAFLIKPASSDELIAMIRNLRDWLKICQFPSLE